MTIGNRVCGALHLLPLHLPLRPRITFPCILLSSLRIAYFRSCISFSRLWSIVAPPPSSSPRFAISWLTLIVNTFANRSIRFDTFVPSYSVTARISRDLTRRTCEGQKKETHVLCVTVTVVQNIIYNIFVENKKHN